MPLAGGAAWAKVGMAWLGWEWEPAGWPGGAGMGGGPFPFAGTTQAPCQPWPERVPTPWASATLSFVAVAPLFVLRAWVFLLLLQSYVPVSLCFLWSVADKVNV